MLVVLLLVVRLSSRTVLCKGIYTKLAVIRLATIGRRYYWSHTSARSVGLYTGECVVDSSTGLWDRASTKPLLLSVPNDMFEVSFPLTGTVLVHPGDCIRPTVLDGFLWGWPFIIAGGTALVRGRRFLFCLLLHFLGWFTLAGSQRRVTIGITINFGLLGRNFSANAFGTSLSG